MNSNQQNDFTTPPTGVQHRYGSVGSDNMSFGTGSPASLLHIASIPESPAGHLAPLGPSLRPSMPMPPHGYGMPTNVFSPQTHGFAMSTTDIFSPVHGMPIFPGLGQDQFFPGSGLSYGVPGPSTIAGSTGFPAVPGPAFPSLAPPAGSGIAASGIAASGITGSGIAASGIAGSSVAGSGTAGSGVAGNGDAGSGAGPTKKGAGKKAAGKKDAGKPPVMLRARRKERKTPARPFSASRPLIPLLDTMTAGELSSAQAHNTRVAAERKENERRRNNQSAKRARIRKMATAVSLGDEIERLRAAGDRARAEAELWKELAYQRDGDGGDVAFLLPPRDSDWAVNPLGPPPQDQHSLEGHYADEVKDMRRCLKEYVRGEDLVDICTREFHDEIAAVLKRGDEIRAGLGLEEGDDQEEADTKARKTQSAGAAAAEDMDHDEADD